MAAVVSVRTFETVRLTKVAGPCACVFAAACTSVERVEIHDVTHVMALREANVVCVNGVEQRGYVGWSRKGPMLVTAHEEKLPLHESDQLTVNVRYRPGDVVTPPVAVALRERSVEIIVGSAALVTLGALIASASIYGAVTYKPPSDSSSGLFCLLCGVGQQVEDFFGVVGVTMFVIGAVLLTVGIVARTSIKSTVQRGLVLSF